MEVTECSRRLAQTKDGKSIFDEGTEGLPLPSHQQAGSIPKISSGRRSVGKPTQKWDFLVHSSMVH